MVRSQNQPVLLERRKCQLNVPQVEIGTVAANHDDLLIAKICQSLDCIFQPFAKRRSFLVVNLERCFGDHFKPWGGEDMHVNSGVCPRQGAVALEQLLESARPSSPCAIESRGVRKKENGLSFASHQCFIA